MGHKYKWIHIFIYEQDEGKLIQVQEILIREKKHYTKLYNSKNEAKQVNLSKY